MCHTAEFASRIPSRDTLLSYVTFDFATPAVCRRELFCCGCRYSASLQLVLFDPSTYFRVRSPSFSLTATLQSASVPRCVWSLGPQPAGNPKHVMNAGHRVDLKFGLELPSPNHFIVAHRSPTVSPPFSSAPLGWHDAQPSSPADRDVQAEPARDLVTIDATPMVMPPLAHVETFASTLSGRIDNG